MMNQSFDGIHGKNWERLAIVVDKKKRPLTARFYQIKAGELKWSENLIDERVPYRVSCYTCHANGPRAIRPVPESKKANLGFFEKAKLLLWNTRIKSYGRIHYDPTHDQEDLSLNPPFRDRSFKANDPLPVKTCLQCHQEDGLIARGALTRQHSDTIKYLVENKQMPPLGFSLTEAEKNQLVDYLKGF
ncbi:MAG: c-type cytochrome [Bacteriovoracaceae bacterium]